MDKEKILVIDDEPDMLSGCQKFLEEAEYAVVVAESGEAGLALFETENPLSENGRGIFNFLPITF